MPDWALGGHLAMSVNVRVSAERERIRLGYLADACITHRRDDVRPQLLSAVQRVFSFGSRKGKSNESAKPKL